METIYKNEILGESGCCNVNFLVHDNKFYVMDNHLCARTNFDDFNSLANATGIRYDNYIDAFYRLHPGLLIKAYFCTHHDGSDWRDMSLKTISSDATDVGIYDLVDNIDYWIGKSEIEHWILNIDLDFFFQGQGEE